MSTYLSVCTESGAQLSDLPTSKIENREDDLSVSDDKALGSRVIVEDR